MKQRNKYTYYIVFTIILLVGAMIAAHPTFAAISNPVIDPRIGTDSPEVRNGVAFGLYFVMLWNAAISLGGVITLLYFIWGAIDWITAGGDSGKLKSARDKMIHAFIGMFILAFSFIIVAVIDGIAFGDAFSILDLRFGGPSALEGGSGGGPPTPTPYPSGIPIPE